MGIPTFGYKDLNQSANALLNYYLFNDCAQRSVLLWIPCAIYWFCLPWELWRLLNQKRRDVPGPCKYRKIFQQRIIILICVILSICCYLGLDLSNNLIQQAPISWTFMSSFSFIALLVTLCSMVYVNVFLRRRAHCTSISLWLGLLALVACGFIECVRSIAVLIPNSSFDVPKMEIGERSLFFIYYVLIFVAFLVHSSSPGTMKDSAQNEDGEQPMWPEYMCSLPSRLYFTWFNGLMWQGFKRPIELNDMFRVSNDERAETINDYFAKCVEAEYSQRVKENK
uniref:Uncharacterized protein n=1 Tax=Romanomermis culicivorax TaxID=13658 RepID=A0A915HFC4_ROMCU